MPSFSIDFHFCISFMVLTVFFALLHYSVNMYFVIKIYLKIGIISLTLDCALIGHLEAGGEEAARNE